MQHTCQNLNQTDNIVHLKNNESFALRNKTVHKKMAWVVILTASLFFFYEFIQMNLFNTINEELRKAFNLNAVDLGQLFSMYFYANFICLFPAGNLLDRYSTKKLLIFAVIICTFGTFLFTVGTKYWVVATGRLLVGAGASFCFLSCVRIASRWFPANRMALVTGVVVTMAMLGGLVAQTPFTWLINQMGDWRTVMWLNTGLGVLILLAIVLIVEDWPPDATSQAKSEKLVLSELGLWKCIKLAALNPQNWLGGIYTALINLPVFILGGLWGILYLTKVHHLSFEQGSYATTIFFIGVIFGSLVFGWFSDWLGRRVFPMAIGALLSLFVTCALMFIPNLSLASIITLFFLIGFVTSSQVLTYPALAELNPSYLTSTAISIDSLCIMASGFIVPPFFGWLMEGTNQNELVNGVIHYSAKSFHHAMLIMPIAFLVGLVITLFMQETYCKPKSLNDG